MGKNIFDERVEVRDNEKDVTAILDALTGRISAGGAGTNGSIAVLDAQGQERIRFDATTGMIVLHDSKMVETFRASSSGVVVRDPGSGRSFTILDSGGVARIRLGVEPPTTGSEKVLVGGLRDSFNPTLRATLGHNGDLKLGGAGHDGDVILYDKDNQQRIHLSAEEKRLRMRNKEGVVAELEEGDLTLGGSGTAGSTILKDGNDANRVELDAIKHRLILRDHAGAPVVVLGHGAGLTLGHAGVNGQIGSYGLISLNDQQGRMRVQIAGDTGTVTVLNQNKQPTVVMDGQAGDIQLPNGDCAEIMPSAQGLEPGTVVVINEQGLLTPCEHPYDTRVAGVVAGAGGFRPGLLLGARETGSPLALVGRVACKADASQGPILPGMLLTTSARTGHAMAVPADQRRSGTIFGKALTPLASGTGLVQTLLTLN